MEEAIAELRQAVVDALSISARTRNAHKANSNDTLVGMAVGNEAHDGESTQFSSLSGSIPSDRSNAMAARRKMLLSTRRNGLQNRTEQPDGPWHWQLLQIASTVETAVSKLEIALYGLQERSFISADGTEIIEAVPQDDGNGSNLVDLLVAVLTNVPRSLRQDGLGSGEENQCMDGEYKSSMDEICLSAASIAGDLLRKLFVIETMPQVPNKLDERHIQSMVDEILLSCVDSTWWPGSEFIVELLNEKCESIQLDSSCLNDCSQSFQSLYSFLSSKESLQLFHALICRYLEILAPEHSDSPERRHSDQTANSICYIVGYLLKHFSDAVNVETEQEAASLRGSFVAWATSVDQNSQRLNGEEIDEVQNLLSRFHICCIETSHQLVVAAEALVSDVVSRGGEDLDDEVLERMVAGLRLAIRHAATVYAVTDAAEKLGVTLDPDAHTVFDPFMVSYARFTVSLLHEALLFLRNLYGSDANEGEETRIMADHMLLGLATSSMGLNFFESKSTSGDDSGEVFAIALLRTLAARRVTGMTGKLLLETAKSAADEVLRHVSSGCTSNANSPRKKMRLNSGHVERSFQTVLEIESSETGRQALTNDVLLSCLNFTCLEENCESRSEEAAEVMSALLRDDELTSGELAINPWLTLHPQSMKKLGDFDEDDPSQFLESIPNSFNTRSSIL